MNDRGDGPPMRDLLCPLDFRYGRDEMKAIFTKRARLENLLAVEAALARAQADLGIVPDGAAEEITAKASTDHVDPDRVDELEAKLRHDIMAMAQALAEACEGDAGSYVHLGATSYDIVDTANALAFDRAIDTLLDGLAGLRGHLVDLAEEHRDTVMVGRTHGQRALPMTFGLKVAVFADEVARHEERLTSMRDRVVVGKMGGAIGTGAGFQGQADAIRQRVGDDLGIQMADVTTQIVGRDRYIELVAELANLATTLEKLATEVRNLQRSEIGEVQEAFGDDQVGSSTMAQKRNPIVSERISGLSRTARAFLQPTFDNAIQWHERDLANSSAERFTLPHSFVLVDACIHYAIDVFSNLVVHEDRMRDNVEADPSIMAETVIVALVDAGMARHEAHEVLRQVSMQPDDFRDALLDQPEVAERLSEEEIDALLEPASYLGESGEIVDRVVDEHGN